jgi:hypothetical protein
MATPTGLIRQSLTLRVDLTVDLFGRRGDLSPLRCGSLRSAQTLRVLIPTVARDGERYQRDWWLRHLSIFAPVATCYYLGRFGERPQRD